MAARAAVRPVQRVCVPENMHEPPPRKSLSLYRRPWLRLRSSRRLQGRALISKSVAQRACAFPPAPRRASRLATRLFACVVGARQLTVGGRGKKRPFRVLRRVPATMTQRHQVMMGLLSHFGSGGGA